MKRERKKNAKRKKHTWMRKKYKVLILRWGTKPEADTEGGPTLSTTLLTAAAVQY